MNTKTETTKHITANQLKEIKTELAVLKSVKVTLAANHSLTVKETVFALPQPWRNTSTRSDETRDGREPSRTDEDAGRHTEHHPFGIATRSTGAEIRTVEKHVDQSSPSILLIIKTFISPQMSIIKKLQMRSPAYFAQLLRCRGS